MTTSEQINELAGALAKAQGEMTGATKSSDNPFFKSKYADLASVRDACMGPLTKHGIAVVQSPEVAGNVVTLETRLMHSSGQWIAGSVSCAAKDDSPQAIGSAISYLKRYSLQSFVVIASEDDDGEAAQGRGKEHKAAPEPVRAPSQAVLEAPDGYAVWLDRLANAAGEGSKRLDAFFLASHAKYRAFLTGTDPKRWNAIKAASQMADEALASKKVTA